MILPTTLYSKDGEVDLKTAGGTADKEDPSANRHDLRTNA